MTREVHYDDYGVAHVRVTHTTTTPICDHHYQYILYLNLRQTSAPVTCIWCIYELSKEP